MKKLTLDFDELLVRVQDFYNAFKNQWFIDNKPHGFDVQDIRIGGLIMRIKSCKDRISDYVDGKIECIDELEENLIDLTNGAAKFEQKTIAFNDWAKTVTVNVL